MRHALLVLLLLALPSHAAETLSTTLPSGIVVTLDKTACNLETIVAMIKPEVRKHYQSGKATFQGETLNLCWRMAPNGQLWIVDETGGYGEMDPALFAPKGPRI